MPALAWVLVSTLSYGESSRNAIELAPMPPPRMPQCDLGKGVNMSRLIHIPKTGGGAIEYALFVGHKPPVLSGAAYARTCSVLRGPSEKRYGLDMRVNRKAWRRNDTFGLPGYACPIWHIPPWGFVKGSYCVIRHPYERLVSAYNYWRDREGLPQRWFRKNCNCNVFETWALNRFVKESFRRGSADLCHHIPQIAYAQGCEALIPYEAFAYLMPSMLQMKQLPTVHRVDDSHKCFPRESARKCVRVRRMVSQAYRMDMMLHKEVVLRSQDNSCKSPWRIVHADEIPHLVLGSRDGKPPPRVPTLHYIWAGYKMAIKRGLASLKARHVSILNIIGEARGREEEEAYRQEELRRQREEALANS